jgi:hypothetical protein
MSAEIASNRQWIDGTDAKTALQLESSACVTEKSPVRSYARNPTAALLALFGILLSANVVLAADFSVDFGADTDQGRDAGSLDCRFGQVCSARMESLGLTFSVDIFHGDPVRAHVHLYGRDPSCCYFADAAGSITIDPSKPPPVPFFKGARARGGLFVQNERVGALYLKFRLPRGPAKKPPGKDGEFGI